MAIAYLITSASRTPGQTGWRLFAVNTATGAAYEQNGGFPDLTTAERRRDRLVAERADPDQEPDFVRMWMDARIVDATTRPPA